MLLNTQKFESITIFFKPPHGGTPSSDIGSDKPKWTFPGETAMRHPIGTNVHGVPVKDHVFASKFPLQKSVTGQMPLVPHAMQVVVANATLSKSSVATSLADTIVTDVIEKKAKDVHTHINTNPAVIAPSAMALASLMAEKAALTRATRPCAKPAYGTHFAGGEFQGSFPVAAHASCGAHQLVLLAPAPLLTHPWPELPDGCW
jgi:hypothetical protein